MDYVVLERDNETGRLELHADYLVDEYDEALGLIEAASEQAADWGRRGASFVVGRVILVDGPAVSP